MRQALIGGVVGFVVVVLLAFLAWLPIGEEVTEDLELAKLRAFIAGEQACIDEYQGVVEDIEIRLEKIQRQLGPGVDSAATEASLP